MPGLRLSERLSIASSPGSTAGKTPHSLAVQSVIDHLVRLLNTRKGSVPVDANYGMNDLSNIAGSYAYGTTESICAEVATQIHRYEPRLKDTRISAAKSDDERQVITLRFDVISRFVDGIVHAGDETLTMVMRINSGGRISLERRQDL